jgi:hypothetical protein
MLAPMRRKALTLSVAIGLAAAVTAAPAGAAFHSFKGDRGTTCQIEVGAFASDSLGALSGPPQVGYSAVPSCAYRQDAKRGAPAKQGRKKSCRKRKGKGKGRAGKRAKRRCAKKKRKKPKKKRKQKGTPARAAATLAAPAPVDLVDLAAARLLLLGPSGGVTSVGEETMQAPPVGYSCTVGVGVGCADSGRLLPAIPGVTYVAEFTVRVAPPAGESWTTRPAGCGAGPVPACELRSASVTPDL